jgi:hypothetical protein
MKRYQLIIAILIAGMLFSCHKLDIKPKSILTSDVIFGGEGGIDAYMADIYRKLPIEDFTYRPGGRDGQSGFNLHHEWEHFWHSSAVTGESVGPYGGMDIGGGFGYWPYAEIRAVNNLMQELPKNSANFTDTRIKELTGEAYFCRAYFYFAMAKRYGGVPIIKTVQNYPEQTIEELQVHRDKEQDVWTFIGEDLDKAFELMPVTSPRGRANKYAAAALKSRAMLYAGSIAKYGSVNFVAGEARTQGFVGIPATAANGFFTKAWDAAKLVEGHYSLYQKDADKVKNYADAFLDQTSPENILVRDYSIASNTAHSWDATFSPRYMTADGDSRSYPTLDFVQKFTTLPITNADGTPRRFDKIEDLMTGLEPRLLATVYFPGASLRGYQFDTQRGLYTSFTGTAAAEVAKPADQRTNRKVSADENTLYEGKRISGITGIKPNGSPDKTTRTGFYVRKYIDYNRPQNQCGLFQSTQSWIELRYAEVLLNRAEAAAELGNTADATTCINLLRTRAGATLAGSVSINDVRLERNKELAFENHYWWDLKRWRTADIVLDNTKFRGLMPYYVFNEGKYIFLNEPEIYERNYFFDKKYYYEPIPGGELGKNPNLFPNNPNY